MAYAVLLSLSRTINQILKPDHFPVSDEPKQIKSPHKEFQFPISEEGKQRIQSLHEKVLSLHEFIETCGNEAADLETRITTAANEAEDILEHFMYEHIRWRHKMVRTAAVRQTALDLSTDLHDFRELKWPMEEIDGVAEEAAAIKSRIKLKVEDSSAALPSSSEKFLEALINNETVGQEEDLEKIRGLLCQGSSKREIVPITGMGGIGKTTLARDAYNLELVKENFKIRAWVPVSHNYKIENIFANLLETLKNVNPEIYNSDNTPQDKVYRILGGHRYLIVLDDLWTTNAWDDMKRYFPTEQSGSRILITTREKAVAVYAAGSETSPHEMQLLDEKHSQILLEKRVFANKECPTQLKDIGMSIAISCGRLPLAIVLVAGILSHVLPTPEKWNEIANNVRSALAKESEGMFEERIALSYTYLPHNLRQCFLYMGGFPEDHEILVSKLMRLWVAEDFIKTKEGQTVEAGAEKFLEDIVKRNLAMVTTIKSTGKIKSCNVHDMVRDLCKTRSLDENYERRLSFNHPDLTRLARAYGSTLRSVLAFQPNESSLGGLRKFRLLRLLDVVDTEAYSLPAPVFELFHLRYLAYGCPMELPPAISRLHNVRTLVIRPSKRFRTYSNDEIYLPLEIWSLTQLRDLFSFFDLLPNPEGTASPMEKLLTLSVVKKLICTKELMKMIPNIKKLGITYFGDKYKEDYQLENLVLLEHLEKLKLIMKADSLVQWEINPVYPETLRKLTLSGWGLEWKHLETIRALHNLQVLKLRDHACKGNKWKTVDEFPSLEYLLIDTSDLEEWETDKDHFPKLKRLVIYGCKNLNQIEDRIGEITTLELIEVDHSNENLVEYVKAIREDCKDVFGDKTFKFEHVHYKGS